MTPDSRKYLPLLALLLLIGGCATLRPLAQRVLLVAGPVLCEVGTLVTAGALGPPYGVLTAEVARAACEAGVAALLLDPEDGSVCVLVDPEDMDGQDYQLVCFDDLEAARDALVGSVEDDDADE